MAKWSYGKKIPILLFTLVFILACNMPIADLIDNPLKKPTAEELDQEIEQINSEIDRNFEGFQTYHVKPFPGAENSTECKPGFEFGDRWTDNSIMRFDADDDWDRSQIEIEAGENHVLTYKIVIKEKPNTFCRLNEQNFVECVYLDTDGYTVRVFNDPPYTRSFLPYVLETPKTCFTMVFEGYDQDQRPVAEDTFTFDNLNNLPDNVEIALGGPIPALPLTSNGQYFSNEGKESAWYFAPQNIEKWVMSIMTDDTEKKIMGNFSAIALYYYEDEDKLTVSEGHADIIGSIPSSQFTIQIDQNTQFITAPFEMTFTGSVHQPNQFASSIYKNNILVPRYIKYLVYHDVDFEVTVFGTFKLVIQNDGTESLEMEVTDCENSKFSSPNEGAQLTECSIRLVWDNIPVK